MGKIALCTLIGTAAGVLGTALGGSAAYLFRTSARRLLGTVLDFAAGVMLAVVCFELLPGAFERAPFPAVLSAAAAGVVFVMLAGALAGKRGRGPDGLAVTAFTVAVGIAAHNIPEGLAIGAGLMQDMRLGASLAAAMFLHNIPEGLGIGLPMRIRGLPLRRTLLLSCLAGLPTGAGALAGALAERVSASFTAACLSGAGGAMLCLALGEMLPEAHRLREGAAGKLSGVVGVLSGAALGFILG